MSDLPAPGTSEPTQSLRPLHEAWSAERWEEEAAFAAALGHDESARRMRLMAKQCRDDEAGALCPWGAGHPAHEGDCPGDL